MSNNTSITTLLAALMVGTGVAALSQHRLNCNPNPVTTIHPGTKANEISIFSANTYLIPWFFVYKMMLEGDKFAINSCKDQHERATLLTVLASSHDVVALQEIWGGATDIIQREFELSHEILEQYQGWKGIFGSGLGADYVNTLRSQVRRNGGLWFGVRKESTLNVVWSHHHTFINNDGEEVMHKSVSFALLNTGAKWGAGTHLLVVNTHLHSPNPFNNTKERRKQRKELNAILSSLPERLRATGNDVDWSRCGAVLVGDLNTAFCCQGDCTGTKLTDEYLETLKEFDARDLFLENDSFNNALHRGKFTYDGAANPYVSDASKKDSSRMDYALALNSLQGGAISLMKLRASRCEIVDSMKSVCSDHWPLSLNVSPL